MEPHQIITWPYRLRRGHSKNPAEGACAMDAVNWLVHGEHGDQPACACPVIGAFVIRGNDAMPDDIRQRLLPFLPRIAGSRSPQHERARCEIMVAAARKWSAAAAAAKWSAAAAAEAAEAAGVWDDYFVVLDAALNAGPQGEPWSADALDIATTRYVAAGGVAELVDIRT